MTEPTGLEILKNSGYKWAIEAAELWERDIEMLQKIQAVVDEQAEDEALWSLPCDSNGNLKLQPIGEAMLQQALRRLHAVIEGEEWNER